MSTTLKSPAKPATPRPYATGTKVDAVRSQQEIETTLKRYGASEFGLIKSDTTNSFSVAFVIPAERNAEDGVPIRVRFTVFVPDLEQITQRRKAALAAKQRPAPLSKDPIEDETNRLWRALAQGVKFKLVLVDDGIETLTQALFQHIVNPASGQTVYEETRQQVAESYKQLGPRRAVFTLALPSKEDG